MSVKKIILIMLFSVISSSLSAEIYWLNMPGSYSKKYSEFTPSVSLPTVDYEACQAALTQYAQDNEMVEKIGCDIQPLPDAVNLADHWAAN